MTTTPSKSQFTNRRPWHADAPGNPYFVSTRTHKSIPIFAQPGNARSAVSSLMHVASTYRYEILAYCFMPDHAHIVLVPPEQHSISNVMRIVKGAIARSVNATAGRSGPVWQSGFFDKVPRDIGELNAYIAYIENNPVVARFVTTASAYEFSSARGQCMEAYYAYVEGNGEERELERVKAARAESPRSIDPLAPNVLTVPTPQPKASCDGR